MKNIILSLILLSCFGSSSFSQSIIENDLKDLTLSFAQRTSIQEIKKGYLSKYKEIKSQLATNRKLVKEKIDAQSASDQEIAKLQQKNQQLQNKLADLEVEYMLKIQKVLDEEQIKVLRYMSYH